MIEQQLFDAGYRKYGGDDIQVFFNTDICTHSRNCVRGNPAVFDVLRKPWIMPENAPAERVAQIIETCPSGALQYIKRVDHVDEV